MTVDLFMFHGNAPRYVASSCCHSSRVRRSLRASRLHTNRGTREKTEFGKNRRFGSLVHGDRDQFFAEFWFLPHAPHGQSNNCASAFVSWRKQVMTVQ